MHYYQHHIGDFIRDTSCLSDEQCMAYMRLIWLYYESEQPLPNNPRSLAFRIGASEEVVSLILAAFFKLEDGAWRHTRCDSEIAEYKAICNRNKTNGKAGGRPKKTQSVSDGLPVETDTEPHRNPNQYPVTSNQEDQKHLSPPSADDQPAKKKSAFDPLTTKPPNVSAKVWADFVAHRKGKSKLTAKACELIAAKLAGHPDPDAVLNQSIENGWTGIFPEKVHAASKQPGGQGFNSAVDQVKRAIAEREARSAQAESNNDRQALAEDDGDLRPPLDVEFRRVG